MMDPPFVGWTILHPGIRILYIIIIQYELHMKNTDLHFGSLMDDLWSISQTVTTCISHNGCVSSHVHS